MITIIVHKKEEDFSFEFIDQVVGVKSYDENGLEQMKLLFDVFFVSFVQTFVFLVVKI